MNNMYLFSHNNFESNTGSISGFKVGDYYLCVANMRGLLSSGNFSISGANIIFNRIDLSFFDLLYSSYRVYLKANSDTITFTFNTEDNGSGNVGLGIVCYQFGTKD